jgi:MFS family permease
MILLAVMAVNTAYTVLIPLVPQIERRAGLNEAGIALVFAIYAGAKAITQPLGGLWTDRWSARRVMPLALLMTAICVCLLAAARSPAGVLAARAGWGVGDGLLTPALYQGMTDLCARYSIPANRSMAWFGASAVIGMLLGPAFAALAIGLGVFLLCIVCSAIIVATGLGVYAAQRELPKPNARAPAVTGAGSSVATRSVATRVPQRTWLSAVLLFGTLDLLTNLAYSGLEPTIPLYLTPPDPRLTSVVFMLGLATFAVASWQLGRRPNGPSPVALIVLGCLIGMAGFAGFSLGTTVWTVAPSMVIVMISQPMLYLAARWGTAELRKSGGPTGLAFGVFGAVSDVGYMLGPLVSVALIDAVGAAGFAFLGLIGALGLLSAWPVSRRSRRAQQVPWLPYRHRGAGGSGPPSSSPRASRCGWADGSTMSWSPMRHSARSVATRIT